MSNTFQIPQNWQIKSFNELLKNGTISKIQDGNHGNDHPKSSDYVKNGIHFVMANCIHTNNYLDLSRCNKISREQYLSLRIGFSRPGDVLLTHKGSIGLTAIVPQSAKEIMLTPQVTLYRIGNSEKLLNIYLYYYFQSTLFQTNLKRLSGQSTRAYIGITEQKKLSCLLPPIEQQKKIAEILVTWDEAIALTEKAINSQKQLKKALMQKLLSGKQRFQKFQFNKWDTIKLGQVAEIRRGASPRPIDNPNYFSENGRGWVRIADVTASKTYLTKTTQYLSELGESKSVSVDPGDLIMSICATIGVPRILNMRACVHDGFVVIRPKLNNFDRLFLYHFLDFISLRLAGSGQPGTQKNLNTTIVSEIKIPAISIELDSGKFSENQRVY